MATHFVWFSRCRKHAETIFKNLFGKTVAEKMFLLSAQEVLNGVLGQLPTSWPKALLVHGPHECSLQIAF